MPLVETIVKQDVPTTFGQIRGIAIVYRKPGDVRPGDTLLEPTAAQLAELAQLYPEEYGDAGAAPRRVAAADDGEGDTAIAGQATELLARYDGLNAKDAIAAIGELDAEKDLETLALWLEAETEREEGPRSTVLEAFKKKGLE